MLREGQPLYVMNPKFQGLSGDVNPDTIDLKNFKHVERIESGFIKLYMMMGRDLHKLDRVPAGNIVGIVGLQEHVLKTATLSSSLSCPSLTQMPYQAKPTVRVAVDPRDPRNFEALETDLQRLHRSDPTVEVHVQETGDHVIVALEPLVGFNESIVEGITSSIQDTLVMREFSPDSLDIGEPRVSGIKQASKTAVETTPDGTVILKLRAFFVTIGNSETFGKECASI
ncbi:putative translation protein, beta-barrel domain superfamily [Plasmopara halstedii]